MTRGEIAVSEAVSTVLRDTLLQERYLTRRMAAGYAALIDAATGSMLERS